MCYLVLGKYISRNEEGDLHNPFYLFTTETFIMKYFLSAFNNS